MSVYGIPPRKVTYGIDLDVAVRELLKAKKYGNQELLVIDNRRNGVVDGCITGQMLLDLYDKKVCRLTWNDMKRVETVHRNLLTREKILKVTRKKRSLFVLKKGAKRRRLLNTAYKFSDYESEITEDFALMMLRKEKDRNYPKPNHPNLIEYTI